MAKSNQSMDDVDLASLVRAGISSAISYDDTELSGRRARAIEYYRGQMSDVPAMEGRSSVTSHDLSDNIGWILPGLMRVFTASETIAVYEPQNPQDDAFAKQATDYINYVFMRECDGYRVLSQGFHEGLLFGNGIWKHWWDHSVEYETLDYTGLGDIEFTQLVSDDDVEVLQHTADITVETVTDPETGQPVEQEVVTHAVKIKRVISTGRLKICSIPPEEFLINSGAKSIEDATLLDHRSMRTKQSLIADGHDRQKVMELAASSDLDDSEEQTARWKSADLSKADGVDPLMVEVEVHEVYLRCDYDGDGHAEWRKVVMAGSGDGGVILANDEWSDDVPFSDAVPIPEPHRWNGRSLFDELEDVQRVKTVLLRQTLDNLYLANRPQRKVIKNQIENLDEVVNPSFGGMILMKTMDAVQDLAVPFVADKSYPMLGYMDELSEKRTGVSRQSMALDPDALQNQTAAGQMMAQSAAYAKIELYARNIAETGLKRLFRCLLKLIVRHQDRPRTIRLRDQWVEMDPRSWNANMDVTVSVGLGSGSRDRDLAILQQIAAKQELIIAQGGPGNGIVTLEQYANTLRKIVETAGIRNPDSFFTELTQDKLQAMQQGQEQKPDPEVQKAQAQIQLEQMKAQAHAELEQQKAAAGIQAQRERMQLELQAARERGELEMSLMREKAAAQLQLDREKAEVSAQLRREEMLLEAELTAQANQLKAAMQVSAPVPDTNIEPPAGV
ncbi:phage portal protein [Falsochrobactrum shanghaiense]|uniref:Phage portal protein n=1 Tax=Falsochrobactrum shanghaiense TaxID=2201899 RepID=A0A316JE62_9HYPH|nr:phage portal protein [Falsochrobactrum shanghaiense]PWL17403.1 phage portal protein [Falsochrobactrum shanghaiense]